MEHSKQGQTLISLKIKESKVICATAPDVGAGDSGILSWFLKREVGQDQDSRLRWQKIPLGKGSEKELGKPVSQDSFRLSLLRGPVPGLLHPARVAHTGVFGLLLVVS